MVIRHLRTNAVAYLVPGLRPQPRWAYRSTGAAADPSATPEGTVAQQSFSQPRAAELVTVVTTSAGPHHHLSLRVDCVMGALTNLVSTASARPSPC